VYFLKCIILIFVVSLTSCMISRSPPTVVHSEYGEMSADSERFKKEASDCALRASAGKESITLDHHSTKIEEGLAVVQLYSFFSDANSCIKSKGWRIKK